MQLKLKRDEWKSWDAYAYTPAGLGITIIRQVQDEIRHQAPSAAEKALSRMPDDFSRDIYESIAAAIKGRLPLLDSAIAEL